MNEQEEFEFRLRLEKEAASQAVPMEAATPPSPTMGQVALNAIPKGVANLANTPVAIWNLAKSVASSMHPQIQEEATPTPNYPMMAGEKLGVINPAYNPVNAQQRIVDAAIQGGVGIGLSPAGSLGGFLKNVGTGLTSGGLGQAVTEGTGSPLAGMAAAVATPLALRSLANPAAAAQNAVRDETLAAGQKAGYVVPPSRTNPTFLNQRLESIAGKAATAQDAAARNQALTNQLIPQDVGLPANAPVTEAALKQVRDIASQPYKEVAALSPIAKTALERLNQARSDATGYWREYNSANHPYEAIKKALAANKEAESYERVIEKVATKAGRPELVDALAQSRMTMAKTHDIERALNLGTADISAPVLGRQLDQAGLAAKSGNIALAGRMQQAFPSVMREGAAVPSAGVSGTDAFTGAMLGTMGYGAAGGPIGLTAAALPLVRSPVRSMILSQPYQRFFAQPDYSGLSAKEKMIQSLLAGRMQASAEQ